MIKKLWIIFTVIALFSFSFAKIPQVTDLSLEQKVGQLFLVHFHGNVANDDAKTLIEDVGVAGFIYFNWANDLTSSEKVYELSHSLKVMAAKTSSIPLLIAVDQEGGLVARLKTGFTEFPGNRALGETEAPELARQCAFAMGQELKAVGINMNLAPVVDINSNPLNPVIGIRSFGSKSETVTAFGKAALQGYKEAGILTSLKHFPGHGDTAVDSHKDLPVLNKSFHELSQTELVPFNNLHGMTDAMMTAHVMVPALDKENCATLSPEVIQGLLREKMGFKGVIITDSLIMKGVLKNAGSVEEAALRAVQAGNDLLILAGRQSLQGDKEYHEVTVDVVKRIQMYLVAAVQEGRLSVKRVDEAVERVLQLKQTNMKDSNDIAFNANVLRSKENLAVSKQVCRQSVKILSGKENLPIDFSNKKIAMIAPDMLTNEITNSSLSKLGKEQKCFFFQGLEPSKEAMKEIQQLADSTDVILFVSYNAWKSPGQKEVVDQLMKKGSLILIAVRDPEDVMLAEDAVCAIATYSATGGSIEAAAEKLQFR